MTDWPTSHRRSAPLTTRQVGYAPPSFHGFGKIAEIIGPRGEVLRTVTYDPYAKPSAPPALKPLPPSHPWMQGAPARRASALASLANDLRNLRPGSGSRIVAPNLIGLAKTIARQFGPELLHQLAEQYGPEGLAQFADWAAGLYGLGPLPTNVPADLGALDMATLSPGAGWTKQFPASGVFAPPPSYPTVHRHNENTAPSVKMSNVAYAVALNFFRTDTDAGVHAGRAAWVAFAQTMAAAGTGRRAWIMDLWQNAIPAGVKAEQAYTQWQHPGPSPVPFPFRQVRTMPQPLPVLVTPYADPMTNPIGRPWVPLLPVKPFEDTRTSREVDLPDGSIAGNDDPLAPRVPVKPRTDPSGPTPPRIPPAVVIDPAPGRPRMPPPRGTKERKAMILGPAGLKAWRIAMAFTEFDDFVDSIFAALPAWARNGTHNRTIQGKLMSIYEHAEHLDVSKAVAGVIANAFEDAVLGRLNRKLGRSLERLTGRRTSGVAFNPQS